MALFPLYHFSTRLLEYTHLNWSSYSYDESSRSNPISAFQRPGYFGSVHDLYRYTIIYLCILLIFFSSAAGWDQDLACFCFVLSYNFAKFQNLRHFCCLCYIDVADIDACLWKQSAFSVVWVIFLVRICRYRGLHMDVARDIDRTYCSQVGR